MECKQSLLNFYDIKILILKNINSIALEYILWDSIKKVNKHNYRYWTKYNKKHGIYKRFLNGKIIECNYKNGERDGLYKEWYNNGQIRVEINYKEGKLEEYKSWYNKSIKEKFIFY